VTSGLIAPLRERIEGLLWDIWAKFLAVILRRSFLAIVVQFLTEVAVLVMVFPTLDTVIEKGQSKVTLSLIIGSVALSLSCLFLAGIISMYSREE